MSSVDPNNKPRLSYYTQKKRAYNSRSAGVPKKRCLQVGGPRILAGIDGPSFGVEKAVDGAGAAAREARQQELVGLAATEAVEGHRRTRGHHEEGTHHRNRDDEKQGHGGQVTEEL